MFFPVGNGEKNLIYPGFEKYIFLKFPLYATKKTLEKSKYRAFEENQLFHSLTSTKFWLLEGSRKII